MYSGTRSAYSPAQFLYTWWMLAGSHLGSYQQHDAHEFLLFVLEMLGTAGGSGSSTCGLGQCLGIGVGRSGSMIPMRFGWRAWGAGAARLLLQHMGMGGLEKQCCSDGAEFLCGVRKSGIGGW